MGRGRSRRKDRCFPDWPREAGDPAGIALPVSLSAGVGLAPGWWLTWQHG